MCVEVYYCRLSFYVLSFILLLLFFVSTSAHDFLESIIPKMTCKCAKWDVNALT